MSRWYKAFLICCFFSTLGLSATVQQPSPELTHGPMLGRQSSHGMGVWGRTSRPAQLRVQFGLSPSEMSQLSEPIQTRLEHDNTGWIELKDLQPDTRYFYRLVVNGESAGLVGSFRTLPSAEDVRGAHNPEGRFNFRFEFGCGNNQATDPALPAFTTMLRQIRDNIHFAILNGDWLYEEAREYPIQDWTEQVGIGRSELPELTLLAPTIVGVWENYKLYLDRAENLAEWHRFVPSYYTFDDHEILNDVFGCGTAGFRSRRAVFRDIAVQAWFDYLGWSNPLHHEQKIHFGRASLQAGSDILTDQSSDFRQVDLEQAANLLIHWGGPLAGVNDLALDREAGDPNSAVYDIVEVIDEHRLRIRPPAKVDGTPVYSIGRRSYGSKQISNCEFFFLDTRSHRELHDLRQPSKPGVSMLGKHQTGWLVDSMRQSNADFFFVISSVNFMIPHVGGGGTDFDPETKDDAWTAFLDEREFLIREWDSLERPVFVLTGDLHNSFAVQITDRVWEFASGPHNSVNHRPVDQGNTPPNGRFQYGPRECQIRWSSYCLGDIPRQNRRFPNYCVVQVNNVFSNPRTPEEARWVAFPRPHVIFQYYDGWTGNLLYAETILASQ